MSTVQRWKLATAFLVVCCCMLAFRVIDLGITRTYHHADQEAAATHIALLTHLLGHEWLGMSEGQVTARLNAYVATRPQGSLVLKRDSETNMIYLEGIRFEFRAGKLVSVT